MYFLCFTNVQIFCYFFNYLNTIISNIFGSHNSVYEGLSLLRYDTLQVESLGHYIPDGCVVIIMNL
jgi:hypothetical protein